MLQNVFTVNIQLLHPSHFQVLVTVPLTLLQKNLIQFSPPLPERKLKAIHSLGAGIIEKVRSKKWLWTGTEPPHQMVWNTTKNPIWSLFTDRPSVPVQILGQKNPRSRLLRSHSSKSWQERHVQCVLWHGATGLFLIHSHLLPVSVSEPPTLTLKSCGRKRFELQNFQNNISSIEPREHKNKSF